MMLHKNTYKIFFVMGFLACLDLLTHNLWAILAYLSAWSVLLFRRSNTILRTVGLTSPVTGIVSNITKSRSNDKELVHISVNTMPLIDPQNFTILPSDKIVNLHNDGNSMIVSYESGANVIHTPNFGLGNLEINHTNITSFQKENHEHYGYSILGCRTTITLPGGYSAKVIQGQKVINGETIIGGQQ